jgi:ribonuclease P protein component
VCALPLESKHIKTLPRCFRLSNQEGFSEILKQKAKVNKWFQVYFRNNSVGYARLGVAISKRVVPSSVQRNNLKRMIRECFREHAHQGVPRDVVVRFREFVINSDRKVARVVLNEVLNQTLVVK